MMIRFKPIYLVAGVLPFMGTGCIVIGGVHCNGSSVWTAGATERLSIESADLRALDVRTHNGAISFHAQPTGSTEAYVIATKKAGGRTQTEAEEALEAVNVYVKPTGDGAHRIGWDWKGIKHAGWKAQVSFEIHAPGDLDLNAESHNGSVETKEVVGEVHIVTHNGSVTVESDGGTLYAKTHNGHIDAVCAGDDVTLITHNGHVEAVLKQSGAVKGCIKTHNGSIDVAVAEGLSGDLTCATYHGTIKCDLPLERIEASRRKLTGRMGSGEGSLDVTTHNGSIRITRAQG